MRCRDTDKPWRLMPWMTTRIFRERWRRLRGLRRNGV
jgi:hypothetical protein